MSEFQIGLVASLDSSKSKQQLNSDIEVSLIFFLLNHS